jgi:hypothetical protein
MCRTVFSDNGSYITFLFITIDITAIKMYEYVVTITTIIITTVVILLALASNSPNNFHNGAVWNKNRNPIILS